MNFHLGHHVRMEQSLNPQMLQSVQILQMNNLELETAIKQELEINPLLEIDDAPETPETAPEDSFDKPSDDFASDDYDLIDSINDKEIDWDKYIEDGFESDRLPKDLNASDEDRWRSEVTDQQSLQDILRRQLREWKRPPRIVAIVEYLIDCIGEDGFLQSKDSEEIHSLNRTVHENPDIREAEAVLQKQKELEDTSFAVQEAFHVIQSFSPPGIGARDLRESLLIQAYRMPGFSPLAIKILENHFDALKSLHYGIIAKALDVSTEEVQAAVRELSKLTPHPGRLMDDSPVRLIVPDLEVIEVSPGEFKAVMKEAGLPRLRINKAYQKLLHRKDTSKEDKEYIRKQLQNAGSYIKSIDSRKSTIVQVMQAIIERQHKFFARGPEYLEPMILQDIADDIQRDVSTVSRATNGKYVETPHGIYELKRFFSSKVTQKDDTEMSSARIQSEIQNLVRAENPESPLTDQAITDSLAASGIQIARRTVAKYREDLGILPARIRRKKRPV
ncbi:MAG: RNA polymerase factor sigma-54 [Fibrobacter sp.]|jgi:RNA polymerase sigma-54 factor|nr:RNA polymerase factor sigma-54 [Fibrobacter sp.]